MNGIIDQQIPAWDTKPDLRRSMLHENLQAQTSPNNAAEVLNELLLDLDRQMDDHDNEFEAAVDTLRGMYMFSDHEAVRKYLKSNRTVAPVLIEAFPHMVHAFNASPVMLEVAAEEGSAEPINALALWWGKREDARAALQSFDDSWWLDNIRKAGGKIVFDYQIEK